LAALVGALVSAAVLGSFTFVQAQQGNGSTIRACVHRNSGAVRIVKTSFCGSPLENLISWNQQGPAGPAGVLGFYSVTASGTAGNAFSALCDAGDEVTGGGFNSPGGVVNVQISEPVVQASSPFREGWIAGGGAVTRVNAVCADHAPARAS
jgi:hypothetical protein